MYENTTTNTATKALATLKKLMEMCGEEFVVEPFDGDDEKVESELFNFCEGLRALGIDPDEEIDKLANWRKETSA